MQQRHDKGADSCSHLVYPRLIKANLNHPVSFFIYGRLEFQIIKLKHLVFSEKSNVMLGSSQMDNNFFLKLVINY